MPLIAACLVSWASPDATTSPFPAFRRHQYYGEVPSMLSAAFELVTKRGVAVGTLADQLKWKTARARELLGYESDPRPMLRLVP